MVAPDLAAVVAKVDELNELCRALRTGYLRLHPDAPPSRHEYAIADLAIDVWRRHRLDLRPTLAPLPRSLHARIDAELDIAGAAGHTRVHPSYAAGGLPGTPLS